MNESRYRLMVILQDEVEGETQSDNTGNWCIKDYSTLMESDSKDECHLELARLARKYRQATSNPATPPEIIDTESNGKINAIKELRDHLKSLYGNGASLVGCKNLIEEVITWQQHDKNKKLLDKVKNGHVLTLSADETKTLQRLLATEMNRVFGTPEVQKLRPPVGASSLAQPWVDNADPLPSTQPHAPYEDKTYDDSIEH